MEDIFLTGYLKKKLEPVIYKNRNIICQFIEQQTKKYYPKSYASSNSWGHITINVHQPDKDHYFVEKRLRQILGVKVYYKYTTPRTRRINVNDLRNHKIAESGSYNYHLYWRDL